MPTNLERSDYYSEEREDHLLLQLAEWKGHLLVQLVEWRGHLLLQLVDECLQCSAVQF